MWSLDSTQLMWLLNSSLFSAAHRHKVPVGLISAELWPWTPTLCPPPESLHSIIKSCGGCRHTTSCFLYYTTFNTWKETLCKEIYTCLNFFPSSTCELEYLYNLKPCGPRYSDPISSAVVRSSRLALHQYIITPEHVPYNTWQITHMIQLKRRRGKRQLAFHGAAQKIIAPLKDSEQTLNRISIWSAGISP